jgi:hypothetical protein
MDLWDDVTKDSPAAGPLKISKFTGPGFSVKNEINIIVQLPKFRFSTAMTLYNFLSNIVENVSWFFKMYLHFFCLSFHFG